MDTRLPNRQCWCQVKGEDIKKWRETILVLKNNLLFLYKNDTVSVLRKH